MQRYTDTLHSYTELSAIAIFSQILIRGATSLIGFRILVTALGAGYVEYVTVLTTTAYQLTCNKA
jgi:hypothetical protein